MFIIGSVLMGTTEQILRDIIQSSSLQYIILFTIVSPSLHTLMKFGSVDSDDRAIHYIEDKLLEWMGNMVRMGRCKECLKYLQKYVRYHLWDFFGVLSNF